MIDGEPTAARRPARGVHARRADRDRPRQPRDPARHGAGRADAAADEAVTYRPARAGRRRRPGPGRRRSRDRGTLTVEVPPRASSSGTSTRRASPAERREGPKAWTLTCNETRQHVERAAVMRATAARPLGHGARRGHAPAPGDVSDTAGLPQASTVGRRGRGLRIVFSRDRRQRGHRRRSSRRRRGGGSSTASASSASATASRVHLERPQPAATSGMSDGVYYIRVRILDDERSRHPADRGRSARSGRFIKRGGSSSRTPARLREPHA